MYHNSQYKQFIKKNVLSLSLFLFYTNVIFSTLTIENTNFRILNVSRAVVSEIAGSCRCLYFRYNEKSGAEEFGWTESNV